MARINTNTEQITTDTTLSNDNVNIGNIENMSGQAFNVVATYSSINDIMTAGAQGNLISSSMIIQAPKDEADIDAGYYNILFTDANGYCANLTPFNVVDTASGLYIVADTNYSYSTLKNYTATATQKGVVKIGSGLTIDELGAASVNIASSSHIRINGNNEVDIIPATELIKYNGHVYDGASISTDQKLTIEVGDSTYFDASKFSIVAYNGTYVLAYAYTDSSSAVGYIPYYNCRFTCVNGSGETILIAYWDGDSEWFVDNSLVAEYTFTTDLFNYLSGNMIYSLYSDSAYYSQKYIKDKYNPFVLVPIRDVIRTSDITYKCNPYGSTETISGTSVATTSKAGIVKVPVLTSTKTNSYSYLTVNNGALSLNYDRLISELNTYFSSYVTTKQTLVAFEFLHNTAYDSATVYGLDALMEIVDSGHSESITLDALKSFTPRMKFLILFNWQGRTWTQSRVMDKINAICENPNNYSNRYKALMDLNCDGTVDELDNDLAKYYSANFPATEYWEVQDVDAKATNYGDIDYDNAGL